MELEKSPRRIRLFELLLVTSVAFAGPVYYSFNYRYSRALSSGLAQMLR